MCSVHAIGNNRDILTMKILAEQRGCSRRDGGQSDFRIGIDAAFQAGKERVIGASMETSEKARTGGLELFVAGKFQEAMEKSVNDDQVRIETINSGRENEIKEQSMSPSIPSAANRVQKNPCEKLQEMGTRDGRNSMPNDPTGICRPHRESTRECNVLNTPGVKMDFALLVARETLEQFGDSAFRAMAPVNKG